MCRVVNHKDETVDLFSSIDCKGIVGNDGRAYILDLLRTFPPDLNYFGSCPAELRPSLPDSLTDLGYPYSHRHLLATLRQELIEAFFEYATLCARARSPGDYELFIRMLSLFYIGCVYTFTWWALLNLCVRALDPR